MPSKGREDEVKVTHTHTHTYTHTYIGKSNVCVFKDAYVMADHLIWVGRVV